MFSDMKEKVGRLGSVSDRRAVAIDLLWEISNGPLATAWIELVVASRTDPALNDAVRAASVRFGEGFRVGLAALLDWPEGREDQLEDLIGIVFGQLEALALERVLFAPGEIDPPQFARALETAKRVSVSIVHELDASERSEKRASM